jgi:hypothetical protein
MHNFTVIYLICCLHAVDKVETLKRYKFSLAFENSNEEDYVTEKFFQSLVTGKSVCHSPTPMHTYHSQFTWGNFIGHHMMRISNNAAPDNFY